MLEKLRENNIRINMIHLDALLWRIGTMSGCKIIDYFAQWGLESVGEELAGMLRE